MKTSLKVGIRAGAWLCASMVVGGCSGKTVDLGGRNQIRTDGGGAAPGSGGSGGAPVEGGTGEVPNSGGAGGGMVSNLPGIAHTSKLDLLLMVDNSSSMADKQKVLKSTIPDLVNRITAAASGVTDLHVGVISSSLGDHGAHSACNGNDTSDLAHEEVDDHAHLMTTRPRAASLGVPEIISWDPTQNPATLTTQIQDVVQAVGEIGCGYESQLESVYRFLVDPNPPSSINQSPCAGSPTQMCAFPGPRDDALLAQRAAFLRPDSAVVIALLTDESDCSVKDTAQFYYATLQNAPLPRGSSVCVTNPNDPCCYPCSGTPPMGCPADPSCAPPVTATPAELDPNLRCFHEKQRFGIDFLYPVERYVNAFTQEHLCTSHTDLAPTNACPDADKDGNPDIVPNPLFSNGSGTLRDPSMVYMVGIVGVPWQDLAVGGASATELRFKSPSQMASDGTWNVVLGDPEAAPPVLSMDGLMVESQDPRAGNDITGAPIPPPSATPAEDNAINHHDWKNVMQSDLQYACIFPLQAPLRDCATVATEDPLTGCDCGASQNSPGDNNPLCQAPDGSYGTIQYFAKAYPAVRELSVLKGMGNQGLPASICPRNLTDDTQRDYGYRPAIDSLLIQLKQSVP